MTRPKAGKPTEVADGVLRIIAPNPSPMTYWGTNTFLVGTSTLVVIDPGPNVPSHLSAITSALSGRRVSHILVTHAHADHSPLAPVLAQQTGAPVVAFGPPQAGRSPRMEQLARSGLSGGGEGVDKTFKPDICVAEGHDIETEVGTCRVLHTPGHFAGHLAFRFGDVLFSGDHVMEWSSSLVSPPDGDVAAFMKTTRRLCAMGPLTYLPAHGPALTDPIGRLEWLLEHRTKRETAILDALGDRPSDLQQITKAVYDDVAPQMLPAAARNTFAHLIDLCDRGLAIASPELATTAKFQRG